MSVRKLTANLLIGLVILGGITSKASAWDWDHDPVVADPFEFEPDFQWFEPVTNMDLADMKPKKRAHIGWFATYDRTKVFGSRPENDDPQDIDTKLDSGSGHRYDIGFMTEEDSGWLFNWTNQHVRENELIGPELPEDPTLRPFFVLNRAYPIVGEAWLSGNNSINEFDYDSYELNKTWRLEPYHYGGILEPLIGVRYMKINDVARFEDYTAPLLTDPDTDLGNVQSFWAKTKNDMFGGQLGFRYVKFRDRFTFSTDFRAFGGGSWQCTSSTNRTRDLTLVTFPSPIDGPDILQVIPTILDTGVPNRTIRSRNTESFVGFDVRAELAYQLSRHFKIRAGVQMIDVATGVWRGGDGAQGTDNLPAGDQNQDLVMLGGSLGIELNR